MLRRLWYHINFPVYIQRNSSDCGIECLRMILAYHKLPHSYLLVSEYLSFDAFGTNFKSIQDAAEILGLEALPVKVSLPELTKINPLPAILHWNNDHFVVLYKINEEYAWIVDPAKGIKKLTIEEFAGNCLNEDQMQVPKGTVLLFQKIENFTPTHTESKFTQVSNQLLSSWREIGISLISGLCIAFLLSQLHLSLPVRGFHILEFNAAFFILVTMAIICCILGWLSIKYIRKQDHIDKDIERCFSNEVNTTNSGHESIFNSLDCYYKLSYHKSFRNKFWFSLSLIIGVVIYMLYVPSVLMALCYLSGLIFLVTKVYSLYESEKLTARCINEASSLQKEVVSYYERTKTLIQSGKTSGDRNELYAIFKDRNSVLPWRSYNRILNAILIISVAIVILLIGEGLINTSQGIITSLSIFITLMSLDIIARYIWNFNYIWYFQKPAPMVKAKEQEKIDVDITSFDISLKKLEFYYPSQNWNASLRNLNTFIPHGTKLALMGSAGSGKSSLLKLISGKLSPTGGTISIGDIDTTHLSIKELSKYIGFLNEETRLVPGSIAWNITLEEIYDPQRLLKLIKELYLDYIIEGLPEGLSSKIDDEEVYLSPTMTLKILLARLVYLDKPILIIDLHEFDVNDVHHLILYESLFSLCKDKTIIFVTSDIELAQSTDMIIFMEDGEIAEQGSYKELIARNDLFSNYIRQQKMIRS